MKTSTLNALVLALGTAGFALAYLAAGCADSSPPLPVASDAATFAPAAAPLSATWERLRPTADIVVTVDGGLVARFDSGAGSPCIIGCMVLAGNVGRGLQAESPVPDAGLTGAQADELLGDAALCMRGCPR